MARMLVKRLAPIPFDKTDRCVFQRISVTHPTRFLDAQSLSSSARCTRVSEIRCFSLALSCCLIRQSLEVYRYFPFKQIDR